MLLVALSGIIPDGFAGFGISFAVAFVVYFGYLLYKNYS